MVREVSDCAPQTVASPRAIDGSVHTTHTREKIFYKSVSQVDEQPPRPLTSCTVIAVHETSGLVKKSQEAAETNLSRH